jgi:hypothetical protein
VNQVTSSYGVAQKLALALLVVWPSAPVDGVGTPTDVISRLSVPACAYPCQRFTVALASADA